VAHPLELAPAIVELRQYLLQRGRRDELIELFDRELVDSQEAVGARVIGQFRDVDRVNHFVWLRGFHDHLARQQALTSFYGGPVWREHGRAAAATMIDSDDVHQLNAISEPDDRLGIRLSSDRDRGGNRGAILVVVAHRRSDQTTDQDDLIREHLIPIVEDGGVRTVGVYTTDPTANPYPTLPVRPSNVLVWIAAASTPDTLDQAAGQVAIARHELGRHASANGLGEILLDVLRLEPTERSCLNGTDAEL
jgi:NIPSNAP protein